MVGVTVLLSACIIMVVCAVVMILVGRWVYKDAKEKGLPKAMWTAVAVLVPGFVGLLIYIVYRADKKAMMVCKSCEREIELNVSFCPFCGYQSPSAEAARVYAKTSKGLFALILIPAFVMVFGIIGICFVAFSSFTSASANVRSYGTMESSQSSAYSDEWVASSETIAEITVPDMAWDWDVPSEYILEPSGYYGASGEDSFYESYNEGYYNYSKSTVSTDIVMKYEIPVTVQEITITYQFTGKADFLIEPSPIKSAKSYSAQQGNDGRNFGTYVYDVSAFEGDQITFTISPQTGEMIYDVYFSVSPLE